MGQKEKSLHCTVYNVQHAHTLTSVTHNYALAFKIRNANKLKQLCTPIGISEL